MTEKKIPGPKSERIVVDEIIDGDSKDSMVRLLRAQRLPDQLPDDLGIHTWGAEREDYLVDWRIEAFMGMLAPRKLREGDVFFVVDGSDLNQKYKAIKRKEAAEKHLLVPLDESREKARLEIKKEFAALAATKIAEGDTAKAEKLIEEAERKIEASKVRPE